MVANYQQRQSQGISVLVVGANGRTGAKLVKKFANHATKPIVNAFVRDMSKLTLATRSLIGPRNIFVGDECNAQDIEEALVQSKANVIVVAVGNGDSLSKTSIRTDTAKSIVSVLSQEPFEHVKVMVISSNGAGGSRINVGLFGAGKLLEMALRNVLKDHDGQEAAFRSSSSGNMMDRTVIVRPTALVDNYPTGNIAQFGDLQEQPTMNTDRDDLADWIVEEITGGFGGNIDDNLRLFGNKIATISSVK